jgi:hypothetical protein
MKIDFSKFEKSLPYASEMYGIYQPLLGWRSQRMERRVTDYFLIQTRNLVLGMSNQFQPVANLRDLTHDSIFYEGLKLGVKRPRFSSLSTIFGNSFVAKKTLEAIAQNGVGDPQVWTKFLSATALTEVLDSLNEDLNSEYRQIVSATPNANEREIAQRLLQRESITAGILSDLNRQIPVEQLMSYFGAKDNVDRFSLGARFLAQIDPRKAAAERGVLSPIGVAHLFRQYFFEFDSFLGPSVQHVWLSPGGTVELVEVSTRKTTIERAFEQSSETVIKSELSITNQDEISNAVKSENANSTKFGFGLSTSHTIKASPAYTAQINSTTNLDLEKSQKEARETTHKQMRQATSKLSSELRESFKSTFRTITETTDVSSRRYVLQNDTKKLINYELRRKMRQIGVQVQDYGTQLCWQTYVDKPDLGDQLGLGLLVHVATPSDMQGLKDPKAIPPPDSILKGTEFKVDYLFPEHDDDVPANSFYTDGGLRRIDVLPAIQAGYIYNSHEIVVKKGPGWNFVGRPVREDGTVLLSPPSSKADKEKVTQLALGISLQSEMDEDESKDFQLSVTIFYEPSQALLDANATANLDVKTKADQENKHKYSEALYTMARERIKLAGAVKKRPTEELREEERIIVYRALICQLLKDYSIENVDAPTQHLVAELIQSMFDVDRMLYFVAPDWWKPKRFAIDKQVLGLGELEKASGGSVSPSNTVSWGGANAARHNNYYITETSNPAPLGSSLGWLIQLDGDNLRNAFLNAPWVKAVVPIRPGHEWKALEWLSAAHVEGSSGLVGALYEGTEEEKKVILSGLKAYKWSETKLLDKDSIAQRYLTLTFEKIELIDVLRFLIVKINAIQDAGNTPVPNPTEPGHSYLPTDEVFEKGFDPLPGGFNATPKAGEYYKLFDQWIEVVPTDQIVPVEVEYDAKTGMQK